MDLSQIAELYVLGTFPVDDLPIAAQDALEAGQDSPALRRLAGADSADLDDIRRLFQKALDELGVRLPSPSEAGLAFARRIAGDIARGTIPPYDGAKQIWAKVYTRFPHLNMLRPFVGFASEYEDDVAHREDYSQLIIEESKKLLLG
jgi:hypothetical protein